MTKQRSSTPTTQAQAQDLIDIFTAQAQKARSSKVPAVVLASSLGLGCAGLATAAGTDIYSEFNSGYTPSLIADLQVENFNTPQAAQIAKDLKSVRTYNEARRGLRIDDVAKAEELLSRTLTTRMEYGERYILIGQLKQHIEHLDSAMFTQVDSVRIDHFRNTAMCQTEHAQAQDILTCVTESPAPIDTSLAIAIASFSALCAGAAAAGGVFMHKHYTSQKLSAKLDQLYDLRASLPTIAPATPARLKPEDLQIKKPVTLSVPPTKFRSSAQPPKA